MRLMGHLVRAWQKAPLFWRTGLVASPLAPVVRRWTNRSYSEQPQIFELAAPLEGQRMRLHWQTQKAFVFGTHELEVVRAIQEVVRPGWTVLNIGGHIGYYALLLAKLAGPSGKVFVFEPSPHIFAVLEENIRLNACGNVVLENRAVAARSGRVTLMSNNDDPLTSTLSIEHGRPVGEVEAVRLDEYAPLRCEEIRFVQMDVEGAEAWVLEGMRELLARDRPLLLVELHRWDIEKDRHPALCKLVEFGYEVHYLDAPAPQVHVLATARTERRQDSSADG